MATELAFCCGNCGKRMRVPVNFAGRRGMCPRCEGQFTIPTVEAVEAAMPDRLRIMPDAMPDKPAADEGAGGRDDTAFLDRADVSGRESSGELEQFDPSAALDYDPAADAAAASADGDPFEMDFFAEPTSEAPIEEIEAADLEQATMGPTPVPAEVMDHARSMGLEVAAPDGLSEPLEVDGEELVPLEEADELQPLEVDSAELEAIDVRRGVESALVAESAEPLAAEDVGDPGFGEALAVAEPLEAELEPLDAELEEPLEAELEEPLDAGLEPVDAELALLDAELEEPLDAELEEPLDAELEEPLEAELEPLDAQLEEPLDVELEPLDVELEEPLEAALDAELEEPLDAELEEPLDIEAAEPLAVDELPEPSEVDSQEIAPVPVEALQDDPAGEDGPLELDPDALEGASGEGAADDSLGADGGLGEDEASQWDEELAPPLGDDGLGVDADIGSYLDSAEVNADLASGDELAVPDLEIPTGEAEDSEGGDEEEHAEALTMVLELDDIVEASEETEPPPVGLAEMGEHQLLAHCKQLHQKPEHVKPSAELLARLASLDASADMQLFRGHLRMRAGDQAGALEDYLLAKEGGRHDDESLSAIDRHELDVLLDQVNQFIHEEPDRAANLLRGIVAERPGYGKAHYFLGRALFELGEKGEALTELREAASLGLDVPELDDLEYEVELATLETLREHDPRRLLVKLPPFLARWSSSARGYELLALALRSAGNRQSSLEAYRKARSLGQTSAETDRIIYDLLVDLGRDDDAQAELEKHLEAEAPDPFWLRVKFDQHFMLKNRRESLEALCELAGSADGNEELLHSVRMLFGLFEPQEGITALRKARSLDPDSPRLARLLADSLTTVGAYGEALDIYTSLLELAPDDPGILMSRALCWQMQMPPHPEKALADLRTAFP